MDLETFDGLDAEGRAFAAQLFGYFAPPGETLVSHWAAGFRYIAKGAAEPGLWRNDRAPYVVEPMDAACDDQVHTLVIAGSSQSAKTSVGENIVAHAIATDPCTVLWVTPSDDAQVASASRWDAAIEASPELARRFGTRSARSRVNNQAVKEFDGGKLVLGSAGSPTSLASHPSRLVVLDEVDRYPANLKREGDPVALARARMTTFARKKLVAISSPTLVGLSRIEGMFQEGDRREWHWRCSCGAEHVPDFDNVEWEPKHTETARYVMPCCGQAVDDAERLRFMAAGRWLATGDGKPGVRSYRFRGLSSPWIKLADLAAHYEAAIGKPNLMQPFVNTELGLAYEPESGAGIDGDEVRALSEDYPADTMPSAAALVVAGVDVQAKWLNLEIVAMGDADEIWCLQHHEVEGDPLNPATWARLELLLSQRFRHPSGQTFDVEVTAVDSGFQTQTVIDWTMKQRAQGRSVFATKGLSGQGRPIWSRGGDVSRSLAKHFLIGVDEGKAQIMAGLMQPENGPAKVHTRAQFPAHWWQWATAEECVTKDGATGPRREWRLRKGLRRNEVLDCLVLCLACRHSLEPMLISRRLERLAKTGSIRPPTPSMAELAARMAAVTQN